MFTVRLLFYCIYFEISVELPVLRSVYSEYQTLKAPSVAELDMPKRWSVEPLFTNFAASWNGTLDYLLIDAHDTRLLPVSVLELPDVSEVNVQVALPNDKFSSDHVCLAATLRLSAHPAESQ
jgi:mRNA deadenylase 3'-5' endonuclease subunit Ccr4